MDINHWKDIEGVISMLTMRAICDLNLEMINRFYLCWLHLVPPVPSHMTSLHISTHHYYNMHGNNNGIQNTFLFFGNILWQFDQIPRLVGQYINHVKLWEGFTLRLWSKVINWCPVEFHWIIITNNNESEGKIRNIYHSRCHPRLVIGQYIAILSCDWTMCNPRTALWPRPLHCCVLCPQTNILNRIRWQKLSSVLNLLVHYCTCEEDDILENICNKLCLLLGHRFQLWVFDFFNFFYQFMLKFPHFELEDQSCSQWFHLPNC